ncbi:MAG: endonuclease III, partial [Treponema sp.]|nr:endonuclease III [Treponema sp.]
MKPKWDTIFSTLENWREALSADEPAVNTVAGHYRRDPWAILVSTILSLRTKDEVTLEASRRLLEK